MILNLSPKWMASCCAVCPQLDRGMVHFFLMFRYARYTSLKMASSFGKTPLVLVTLRT